MTLNPQNLPRRRFDCLIIGAGGAGLRAALQLAEAQTHVAVVSKVFPTRSHTVAAGGGINAALGNVEPDHWHWHLYDTVKGGDYLGDQDAIEYMCRAAPKVVYELEHIGVPFSRLEDGRIYQRPMGGQSQNFGGAQAWRSCAAADRTGHAILQTLYQKNLQARTHFFDEYLALDLIRNEQGCVLGALVMDIATGEVLLIEAKTTLLATGGAGVVYATTTNAMINTGDGMAMALRAGVPLQDMEFIQFHPTGIAGRGLLVTEGAQGEGGFLQNATGDRFMERYAPLCKDLASRDILSRAIASEIHEGRGCGPDKNYVQLNLTHLGPTIIHQRLPGIEEMCATFLGINPAITPIPVAPTAHYTMGGIPTNRYGEVVMPVRHGPEESVPGLYAAGECACVSIHGANRLGGNSLLDILVFGRAAANRISEHLQENPYHLALADSLLQAPLERLACWDKKGKPGTSISVLRNQLRQTMDRYCGVNRTENDLAQGQSQLQNLIEAIQQTPLQDHSRIYNTARIEALELENLATVAMAMLVSARGRTESRGAHTRTDYPNRDDQHWLRHSLYFQEGHQLDYKPVRLKPLTVPVVPPQERIY